MRAYMFLMGNNIPAAHSRYHLIAHVLICRAIPPISDLRAVAFQDADTFIASSGSSMVWSLGLEFIESF